MTNERGETEIQAEQWLAKRRRSIGASDAPVIAGLSRYKSRFGLWLDPNPPTRSHGWGHNAEDEL